jgi:hypothetical protein
MPTTPIYALPYPAPGDPADVPIDMQELAERIEVAMAPWIIAHSASIAAPSAALTSLPLTVLDAEKDPDGVLSLSTGAIVIARAGIWMLDGFFLWAGGTGGNKINRILVAGNPAASTEIAAGTGEGSVTRLVRPSAGNRIEAQVYNGATATLNVAAYLTVIQLA